MRTEFTQNPNSFHLYCVTIESSHDDNDYKYDDEDDDGKEARFSFWHKSVQAALICRRSHGQVIIKRLVLQDDSIHVGSSRLLQSTSRSSFSQQLIQCQPTDFRSCELLYADKITSNNAPLTVWSLKQLIFVPVCVLASRLCFCQPLLSSLAVPLCMSLLVDAKWTHKREIQN